MNRTRPVLLHPLALASIALLALNDHVLKARFPGFVTGKLSDLAGMIVAPLVLFVLAELLLPARVTALRAFRRASPWACALIVAIAFALAKTWSPATHAYEWSFETIRTPLRAMIAFCTDRPMWNDRIHLVRDPTDVPAIVAGLVAVWIAKSALTDRTACPDRLAEEPLLASRRDRR